jgi:FkbM family methyltransferase
MQLLSSKLESFLVWYPNNQEYRNLKKEIFTQDTYYFESDQYAPKIIDAGAHIGMATLYFKKLYPFSQITAIEANPESVKILEKNISENNCREVTVIPSALSATKEKAQLFIDVSADHWNSTASFSQNTWAGTQDDQNTAIPVESVLLSEFLDTPTDFLKMDIEGAELAVLTAAKDKLHTIAHLIVEFHPTKQQTLEELLKLLHEAHFAVTLWQNGVTCALDSRPKGLVLVEAVQKR